jgi:hypothetical protein
VSSIVQRDFCTVHIFVATKGDHEIADGLPQNQQ